MADIKNKIESQVETFRYINGVFSSLFKEYASLY